MVSFLPYSAIAHEEEPDATKDSSYLSMYTASLCSKGVTEKDPYCSSVSFSLVLCCLFPTLGGGKPSSACS